MSGFHPKRRFRDWVFTLSARWITVRPTEGFAVTGGTSQAPDPAPTRRCISPTANPSSAESGDGSRRANTSAKLA
jgi:hypothetical protein